MGTFEIVETKPDDPLLNRVVIFISAKRPNSAPAKADQKTRQEKPDQPEQQGESK